MDVHWTCNADPSEMPPLTGGDIAGQKSLVQSPQLGGELGLGPGPTPYQLSQGRLPPDLCGLGRLPSDLQPGEAAL